MTTWLADKSALVRLAYGPDADAWSSRAQRGLVRVATATLLEIGFSARSANDWVALIEEPPVANLPVENSTPKAEARALEVQRLLAGAGQHRAPSVPDLLIAAIAEMAGLTVLHVDKDFELIATITNQPVERMRLTEAAPKT